MNTARPSEQPSTKRNPLGQVLLALAAFVVTFVAVMSATGAYCYYLPRLYCSRTVLEVKQNRMGVFLSQFQSTSFEQIQSKETLYPVIDEFKLGEAWKSKTGGEILSKDEIYTRLVGMLELTPKNNTDFVQIGVYSENRVEAAQIANMIAGVYQKQAREKQQQMADEGLAALRQEVDAQRKTVEDARTEMEKIRAQSAFVDPNPETLDSPQPTIPKAYINPKSRYIVGKKLLEAAESRLSTERLQLKMQSIPVKIWEKAEPSIQPSTPTPWKIGVILGGGAIAGAFFGTLAALVAAVLLSRKN